MDHIAIDLGSSESQICRRDPTGTIVEQKRLRTVRIEKYLEKLSPSRVIVETCSEAFRVADIAKRHGHEVRVVPATMVRSLGVGARGIKTDQRDAALLSEVSCRIDLPSVHVPSSRSREHRSLNKSRERLIAARTMLVNNVRGWARTQGLTIGSFYAGTFTAKVRAAADGPDGIPSHVDRSLESIDALSAQIAAANEELETIVEHDELCQRLMSVPGVGKVTAVRFVAAVDDVKRFPNAHALQSYLGLTPGEQSSGAKVRRTGITKAGSSELRRTLVQAAWSAMNGKRHRNDPLLRWAVRLKERRGPWIAVVALARKIAGILYAIYRDGSRYDASRGAEKNNG
jgi:transposase